MPNPLDPGFGAGDNVTILGELEDMEAADAYEDIFGGKNECEHQWIMQRGGHELCEICGAKRRPSVRYLIYLMRKEFVDSKALFYWGWATVMMINIIAIGVVAMLLWRMI